LREREETVRTAAFEDNAGLDPRGLERPVDDLSRREAVAQEQERLAGKVGEADGAFAGQRAQYRNHGEDVRREQYPGAERRGYGGRGRLPPASAECGARRDRTSGGPARARDRGSVVRVRAASPAVATPLSKSCRRRRRPRNSGGAGRPYAQPLWIAELVGIG